MRRLALTGLGVALLVFVGAACQPITHPTFVVKEGAASAVTAKFVSGDGNFVIVRATAAGATVPSAGWWRVDRRDGAPVQLPGGYEAFSISRTGDRVLLRQNEFTNPVVWNNGTLVAPTGVGMPIVSADLGFALFKESDGVFKRLTIATGAVTPVETGVPRPPGYTTAGALAISDDGNIAQIALENPASGTRLMRFVDIAAHTTTDVPYEDGGGITDTITMAARGGAFVFHHLDWYVDPTDPSNGTENADWVELRDRATGAVRRHYALPANRNLYKMNIAANGGSVWILQAHGANCAIGDYVFGCVDNSEAVVLLQNGARSFSTGGGVWVGSFSTTPSGRFAALDFARDPDGLIPYGPTTVIDWITGTVEHLAGSTNYQIDIVGVCSYLNQPTPCTVPGKGVKGLLSDDGVVVVTTSSSGKGWYEFTPAAA